jgi:uncharacterized membrane protein YedE/YeeE
MNFGFRNLLGRRDTTRFKAYLLAIALQMFILPFLEYFGLITFIVPGFYPLGAVLGGFLFGMVMNWSGGCPASVWYKMGGGSSGALVAIVGLIVGYVTTESGVLKPIRMLLQSVGKSGDVESLTLSSLIHLPLLWISMPLSLLLLFFFFKASPESQKGGWNWRKTGIWVGVIGVIAWTASSLTGRFFGMAILPGSKETLELLAWGNSAALNWDLFFVVGIPIGGYLSMKQSRSFKWSEISGTVIWKFAVGGFLLGVSSSLAGGCTVGHGLTGIPLLSLGSITFIVFAIFGAWAGVIIEKNKEEE